MTSGVDRVAASPLSADDFQVVEPNRSTSSHEQYAKILVSAGESSPSRQEAVKLVAQIATKRMFEREHDLQARIDEGTRRLDEFVATKQNLTRDVLALRSELDASRVEREELSKKNEGLGELVRTLVDNQRQMSARMAVVESGQTVDARDPRLEKIGTQDPIAWTVGVSTAVVGVVSSIFAISTGNFGLGLFGAAFTTSGTNLAIPLALTETSARVDALKKQSQGVNNGK